MMISIVKEIIIIQIYLEQDNFGAPDNNDGMDINNINKDIPIIRDANNNHQPNLRDLNINKNQKLHLITQNNNNNNREITMIMIN